MIGGAAQRRAELVRRFGDGDLIACATLAEGLEHFETSFGFWAHRRVGGAHAALGAPICDPADRPEMLRRFLRVARRPTLFYLREPFAITCAEAGLRVASIGSDRRLDVAALLGSPPREVLGARRRGDKMGFSIEEASLGGPERDRLDAISRAYLARAEITKEIAFLNRPLSHAPDPTRRLFLLKQRGVAFGFAVLNAIYREGRVEAWLLDLLRLEPTKQWGVWLCTVHALAERLRAEGVGLDVGFAPLHGLAHPPGASRALSWQLDAMERRLSNAKYLRRLYELKAVLPGAWEPRAMASHSRSALRALYVFTEASGVGFSYLFGPDLPRVIWRGLREPRGPEGAA
ncbi:MAG: DUF2156 domain-containing protein [Sandaracinaceae bacterium]|nr:DUF2156 domain-containing protein [Sandaracinaceae bacterium]